MHVIVSLNPRATAWLHSTERGELNEAPVGTPARQKGGGCDVLGHDLISRISRGGQTNLQTSQEPVASAFQQAYTC